jgi:hypothetical protein
MSLAPGLGQVYVGYYREGFLHILVVASLITLLNRGAGDVTPFLAVFLAFFWLFNLVDAGRRASHYNLALAGLSPTELPEELLQRKTGNSLASGLALIAFGAVLLAHTRFGFSLSWIENWWPMALVMTGAYLIVQSYADRRQEKTA